MKRLVFILLMSHGAKPQNSIVDLIPPGTFYRIELDATLDTIIVTEAVVPILAVIPLLYVESRYSGRSISQIFTIDDFTLWLTFPECETGKKPIIQIYRTIK